MRVPRRRSSRDVEWCRTVAPRVEDVLDTTSHLCSRRFALGACHEEVVVVGVDMPDGGHDGTRSPKQARDDCRLRAISSAGSFSITSEIRSSAEAWTSYWESAVGVLALATRTTVRAMRRWTVS